MLRGMCDLPGLGIEPASPALAGRFFTAEPGGSASCYLLIVGGNIGFPFVVVTSNESIVKK